MLNVVAIIGRMVKDPELKTTNSGKSVCSFRIANDSGYKDASGQSQTNWLNVTAWGKTAEFVCKYFPKGALIAIDGRLQTRQYQDKNGNNRTAVEIVAQNVSFCGSKEKYQPCPAAPSQRTHGEPDADYALIEDDGDLPF
jgi:single-strand DNA-binding protein|nr:MAG TPA: Single strand binding protein [Bacteriophage sp.]